MSIIRTGETRECEHCKKEIYVPGWKMKRGLGKYCSRQCHAEASKGCITGPGSRYKTQEGYIQIYYPSHPDATKSGYVMEHRLVAEKEQGRRIKKNEHVHHINGVRDDNRPENLQVVTANIHAGITSKNGAKKRQTMREELAYLRDKVALYEEKYGKLLD